MTNFVTNKMDITKKVLSVVCTEWSEGDLNKLYNNMWKNKRKTGGLQLTHTGAKQFMIADLEYYDFAVTPPHLTSSQVLALDRNILCPYHILSQDKKLTIRIWDSRISVLINLHGSIMDYINTLDDKHRSYSN